MAELTPQVTTLSPAARPQPSGFYRWMVLIFVSLAMLGNYYVYDCIAPVADLLSQQLGFSDQNIGLLQAIYSLPNVFMVLIGGVIVDRIGTRKSIFLFGVLCLIGSIIPAFPDSIARMLPFHHVSTLGVMAGGRLIFGLGAESLIVAVTTAVAKWFRGKELSFAFGINLMLARAGSFAAQFSPTWAQAAYREWRLPLVISVGFGSLCVIGAIIYWAMESYGERHYDLGESSTDKINWNDLFPLVRSFALGAVLAAVVYFREKLPGSWRVLAGILGILVIVTLVQAIVKFGGRSYLYIVALCIVFYSAIFPFETFAYKFFIDSHHVTRETAGQLVGMLTLFTMFGTPLFGLFSDRVGKRALLMMGGSLMLIPVYLMMAYTNISLYVPMAMMGISFALIPAVMWPSVAYIVEQNKLGTAYGLMTMIQNIGLAGFNLLIGRENDLMHAGAQNPGGYHLGMWTFSILGFLGVTFALLLRAREVGPHGHGLEHITTRTAA